MSWRECGPKAAMLHSLQNMALFVHSENALQYYNKNNSLITAPPANIH